jgi:hypothetical protein
MASPLHVTFCVKKSTFLKLDNRYLPVISKIRQPQTKIGKTGDVILSMYTIFQQQMQLKSTRWSSLATSDVELTCTSCISAVACLSFHQQCDQYAPASCQNIVGCCSCLKHLSHCSITTFYTWTPAFFRAAVMVAEASSSVLAFFTVLNASMTSPSSHSSKSSTPIPHSNPAPT